jgi:hypothetical protein
LIEHLQGQLGLAIEHFLAQIRGLFSTDQQVRARTAS